MAADINVVLERLKEELTCSICTQILREPTTLPCLHSYCRECLERHIRERPLNVEDELDPPDTRDIVPCPLCNFRVQLGGDAALRPNHCLRNLVQHYELGQEVVGRLHRQNRSRCGLCSLQDNDAVAFCRSTNHLLCQNCLQAHGRMRHLLRHEVVILEEVRANPAQGGGEQTPPAAVLSYRTRKCSRHFTEGEDDPNERITDMILYCHDCREVICCMCALSDHQQHPKNFAKIVINEPDHRPRIKAKIKETENTRENIYTSSIKLHQRKFHIEDARQTTERAIEAHYTRLNSELEGNKKSLLDSIDRMQQVHSDCLQRQRGELDMKRKAIECALKFVKRRSSLGSHEDVVQFARDMIRRMSSLVEESQQRPPTFAYRREITFVPRDCNLAGVMGNVTAEPCVEIFTADDIISIEFVLNTTAEFTITARDVLENEASADNEMVFVELQPIGEHADEIVEARVKKLQNGKCLVSLKPKHTGRHMLKIRIAKAGELRHIRDSPFEVNVECTSTLHLYETRP